MNTNVLLLTPPFTQLNTPYPATAYLKGFLNTKGVSCFQVDLGIEVTLELFSKTTLQSIFGSVEKNALNFTENIQYILSKKEEYLNHIDAVIEFLQGNKDAYIEVIFYKNDLPRASRFNHLDENDWAFTSMETENQAKHLATLFLEDLSDFIVECIDEDFGFSRYAEKLGMSANSFDTLHTRLIEPPTFIDDIATNRLHAILEQSNPQLVCFSVPFPGNLYSAFRCAEYIKRNFPEIQIAMGGGFPNTELRSLTEPRVFDYFDFITLDDGELPIELIINQLNKEKLGDEPTLCRTYVRINNEVTYINNCNEPNYSQKAVGTPDYSDLLLDKYISVIEITNPMHSLWSNGRWNKLTMAHGCYWGKCTFCDISLDYIKSYEPVAAKLLADRVEEIIKQTGENGFHFVDEAAPPALMKAFALEIINRKIEIEWWTNIRFEKSFTVELCSLLADSGCIAVSGGLEIASDRLLKLIDKGTTVSQVAIVTRNFSDFNIMVHAYLMYGYPSQTVQETVDSLEMVRQLFEAGTIQSGFWHQFALTAHSPIGKNPSKYGIKPILNEITFANNDIEFEDETEIEHSLFSDGLKKSLYNFMHDSGFEFQLQEWFDFEIPKTTVKSNFIESSLID
ncbi:MAG: radical SAM protein [Flavobacteriales bacterium]|nr:radical SAM protein [Flavobacteriales bacterium]